MMIVSLGKQSPTSIDNTQLLQRLSTILPASLKWLQLIFSKQHLQEVIITIVVSIIHLHFGYPLLFSLFLKALLLVRV